MQNGQSFITNLMQFTTQEPKLSSPNFLLATLLPSFSLIEVCFALEESPLTILKELLKLPADKYKLQSLALFLKFLESVENSKKSKLVMKDTICLKTAPEQNQ
jgi:hypothetical protein